MQVCSLANIHPREVKILEGVRIMANKEDRVVGVVAMCSPRRAAWQWHRSLARTKPFRSFAGLRLSGRVVTAAISKQSIFTLKHAQNTGAVAHNRTSMADDCTNMVQRVNVAAGLNTSSFEYGRHFCSAQTKVVHATRKQHNAAAATLTL